MSPLVSFVIPAFNAAAHVEQSVRSALGQTYPHIEVLAVDDGSKDRTGEILTRIAREDARLIVISQENRGLTETLNRACSSARGRYIARLDADDVALPQRVAKQVAWFESHPRGVLVGADVTLIDADGNPCARQRFPESDADLRRALAEGCCFVHPATMLSVDAFREVGGYRRAFLDAEDYDLWFRLSEVGEMGSVPEPLILYRIHPGQVSGQRAEQQAVSALGARRSADARLRSGRDPVTDDAPITRQKLHEMGVSSLELADSLLEARIQRATRRAEIHDWGGAVRELDDAGMIPEECTAGMRARALALRGRLLWSSGRRLSAMLSWFGAGAGAPLWAWHAMVRKSGFRSR